MSKKEKIRNIMKIIYAYFLVFLIIFIAGKILYLFDLDITRIFADPYWAR